MRCATSKAMLARPQRLVVLFAITWLLCGSQPMIAAEPNDFLPPGRSIRCIGATCHPALLVKRGLVVAVR